jgi:hypothetical protein
VTPVMTIILVGKAKASAEGEKLDVKSPEKVL